MLWEEETKNTVHNLKKMLSIIIAHQKKQLEIICVNLK